jgi:hypothetical protein
MPVNKIFKRFFPGPVHRLIFIALTVLGLGEVAFISLQVSQLHLKLPKKKKPAAVVARKKSPFLFLDFNRQAQAFETEGLADQIELLGVALDDEGRELKRAKLRNKQTLEEVIVTDQAPIYVHLQSSGTWTLNSEALGSPLYYVPRIARAEVLMQAYVLDGQTNQYRLKSTAVLKPVADVHEKEKMKRILDAIKVESPTYFEQLYGDAPKRYALEYHQQKVVIDPKGSVYHDGRQLLSEKADQSFKISVHMNHPDRMTLTCQDPSGFSQVSVEKLLKPIEKRCQIAIEEPKQVALRGFHAITAVFQGQKIMMKQGDFFYRAHSSWKRVNTLEEWQALVAQPMPYEIFVVEEIGCIDKIIHLKGKIFDRSGWNFQPVAWKFEKKKEKRGIDAPRIDEGLAAPMGSVDANEVDHDENF